MTISDKPCNWIVPGTAVNSTFGANGAFGNISVGGTDPTDINFTPGQTYYINVQEWSPTRNRTQCGNGATCNITVQWYKPTGT